MDSYEEILKINALGSARLTKAFLPLLRRTKKSRIIFISNMSGNYYYDLLTLPDNYNIGSRWVGSLASHERMMKGCQNGDDCRSHEIA